jgi:hypothetical protein
MDNKFKNDEIRQTVKWLEEKISFIENCHSFISEIAIFNETVIRFGKKYYRVYIEIKADLLEVKESAQLNRTEQFILFYPTLKKYIYFPSNEIDEEIVIQYYQWISESCRIRLKDAPFKLVIKEYFKETDDYFLV